MIKLRAPRSRAANLARRERELFCNPAEDAVAVFMRDNEIACSKRGYPDFTIYREDGSIHGFIEVKSRDEGVLKQPQKVFAEFCYEHNIPFLKWMPKDGEEALRKFIP